MGCEFCRLLSVQVDDFLFVTPSYDNAVAFLQLMLHGIPDYNCLVNPAKTLVNFTIDSPGGSGTATVRRLDDGALFPWCGLLIDTTSLAVAVDYTRYALVSMSDTVTVDLARSPGRLVRDRLMFSLRWRCRRIFLDAEINAAALHNVYRVFLLAAFKLHAYAARLPRHSAPSFLVDVVFQTSSVVSSYVAAAAPGLLQDSDVVKWLCLEAFRRKLRRHAGVYQAVLRVIGRRQKVLAGRLDEHRLEDLRTVVGDDLPADFQYMLP